MTLIPAGTRFEAIPTNTKINLRSTQVNNGDPSYTIEDLAAAIGGGGLSGESYIYVAGDKETELENGSDLIAKYDLISALTPYGQTLSLTNKATLLIAPGVYDLGSSTIQLLTPYVNVISLTGERDVIIKANGTTAITVGNQVKIKGIKTTKRIAVESLSYVEIENCEGGDYSFGVQNGMTLLGKFTNCKGGDNSFGAGNNLSIQATFIGCEGDSNCFGYGNNNEIAAIFTNCTGGDNCFGYGDGLNTTATFTGCVSGNNSFGYAGTGSTLAAIYKNCTGQNNCFSVYTETTGSLDSNDTFENCISYERSFAAAIYPSASIMLGGYATNCVSNGSDSFGAGSVDSKIVNGGVLRNCISGPNSFGGQDGNVEGLVVNCQVTSGLFFNVGGGGFYRFCIDGGNNIINS